MFDSRKPAALARKATLLCLIASLAGTAACTPGNAPSERALTAGHPTLDGSARVWPARGSLAKDSATIADVDRAVRAWHTPQGNKARIYTSAIVWLGDVDGRVLGLVAADVPGANDSWLLHVTGRQGSLSVTKGTKSTDPGALVYSDVLPVRIENGTRYLTSTRVETLTVGTKTVPVTDGLSAPVTIPACTPTVLTVTRVATQTLPAAGTTVRLLDLGSDVQEPRYPLITDRDGVASKIFSTIPVCQFGSAKGPFTVALTTSRTHGVPNTVVSWPIGDMSIRHPAEAITFGNTTGTLEIIDWRSATGLMSTAVWRTPQGVTLSMADRGQPSQAFTVTVGEGQFLAVTWDANSEEEPLLPADATLLLSRPGLKVIPAPAAGTKLTIAGPGAAKPFVRTLG